MGTCTVMLQDGRNRIGSLKPDGSIEVNRSKLLPWMRGYRTLNASELPCPAQDLPNETSSALVVIQ